MWAVENRARYDRSGLRYPSDLTDGEWALVEPLIPPAKRRGDNQAPRRQPSAAATTKRRGDKRMVVMHEVVNGLMYVLGAGCQWRAIPKDRSCSSSMLIAATQARSSRPGWRRSRAMPNKDMIADRH